MDLTKDQESFSIEESAEQIAICLKELTLIGRLIFNELQEMVVSLRSGRAPIKLNLPDRLENIKTTLQAFEEPLTLLETTFQTYLEWKKLPQISSQAPSPELSELMNEINHVEQEWENWLAFFQHSKTMLSRLGLLADAERLSAGGWASILDVWEELEQLAAGTAHIEEVTL